jgi:glycosyltransferase involved in cell wall biosynthesis
MCTYDRAELLAEAIECFLRQTVPNLELVIINDREDQDIIFDHPQVKILNCKTRFANTGAKRKATAELATGQYLMFWDDDDIHLPGHTQSCLDRLKYFKNNNISRATHNWCYNGDDDGYILRPSRWVHTLLIDRKVYWEVGGHVELTADEDIAFIQRLLSHGKMSHYQIPFTAPTFIYRRVTGRSRISDAAPRTVTCDQRWQHVKEESDERNVKGRIVIEPRWDKDYQALADAALVRLRA